MAKTKTKKEKIVDLKPKVEKVTEDQLKRIKGAVDRINSTTMSVGQLEARKHQALHFLAGVNDELVVLQNELKEQYGTDDINIEDGTIKYPENGEADKKD
tara:strand:- start:122 stop:421 length:300 start_codon:yes stop_codon:yes gene_type:complete